MKQGQTTLSTHPATLPLVEVGNNDQGVIVSFGRVSVRLTTEPGGTGNVRVAIFGAREFGWPAPEVAWRAASKEQTAEGVADLLIVARDVKGQEEYRA